MKQPAVKFDTKTLESIHDAMRFMVVVDGPQVESVFTRLEDATNHALEVVPFKDKPVHVFSTNHGDCVLTVWPRDVRGGGD